MPREHTPRVGPALLLARCALPGVTAGRRGLLPPVAPVMQVSSALPGLPLRLEGRPVDLALPVHGLLRRPVHAHFVWKVHIPPPLVPPRLPHAFNAPRAPSHPLQGLLHPHHVSRVLRVLTPPFSVRPPALNVQWARIRLKPPRPHLQLARRALRGVLAPQRPSPLFSAPQALTPLPGLPHAPSVPLEPSLTLLGKLPHLRAHLAPLERFPLLLARRPFLRARRVPLAPNALAGLLLLRNVP